MRRFVIGQQSGLSKADPALRSLKNLVSPGCYEGAPLSSFELDSVVPCPSIAHDMLICAMRLKLSDCGLFRYMIGYSGSKAGPSRVMSFVMTKAFNCYACYKINRRCIIVLWIEAQR